MFMSSELGGFEKADIAEVRFFACDERPQSPRGALQDEHPGVYAASRLGWQPERERPEHWSSKFIRLEEHWLAAAPSLDQFRSPRKKWRLLELPLLELRHSPLGHQGENEDLPRSGVWMITAHPMATVTGEANHECIWCGFGWLASVVTHRACRP